MSNDRNGENKMVENGEVLIRVKENEKLLDTILTWNRDFMMLWEEKEINDHVEHSGGEEKKI